MAPLRRYLRISKYSVLECRIYLDNPSLVYSWLLNPRDPVLPKVVESIRPLVLPKLREERERERNKKKSSKKKTVKDVVVQDDFEVSIFLMETSTRHSLIYKTKYFRDKLPPRMESNSTKLIGETDRTVVDVDLEAQAPLTLVLREDGDDDDDDDGPALGEIPAADAMMPRRSKRPRRGPGRDGDSEHDDDDDYNNDNYDGDETASATNANESDTEAPPHKRQRARTGLSEGPLFVESDGEEGDGEGDDDDKKKLAMDVSYEGFAIYGQVLCLVIKKRDKGKQPAGAGRGGAAASSGVSGSGSGSGSRPEGGQAMMENWISSTQMPVGEEVS